MAKPKLPKKLSALILLAVEDLKRVERSKRYLVNMNVFHDSFGGGKCSVCFAGAVIAGTLGKDPAGHFYPDDFSEDVADRLFALDFLRMGDVGSALSRLGEEMPDGLDFNADVPTYTASSKRRFKLAMRRIAKTLAEHGL